MRTREQAVAQIAAALLAASALQGCAGANVLAAIDGPFVPPSERDDGQRTDEVTIVAATTAEPEPTPEPIPQPAIVEVPAPVVVTASEPMPATAPTASAVTAYAAFHRFALERLAASPAGAGRRSMLLADPASLDPALQTCGPRPPAVLIDLDPANSLLPLVTTNRADPLLAALLADLRGRGVAVYWITGHAPGAAAAIRQQLVDSTLDPTGNDPLIVTRFASESKQVRRQTLGQTHCLLAILGDTRGDFDELYDYLRDPALADPLEVLVDHGWFLAPNPLG